MYRQKQFWEQGLVSSSNHLWGDRSAAALRLQQRFNGALAAHSIAPF